MVDAPESGEVAQGAAEYTEERRAKVHLDFLDAKADAWMAETSVAQMMNAIASVFEKHASQDIMDRFREKLAGMMHMCFVEGAFRAWTEISDERHRLASLDALRPAGEGGVIGELAAERRRQVDVEGWSPVHDDQHADRSLAIAAACYTMFAAVTDEQRRSTDLPAALTVDNKTIGGWAAFLEVWPWSRQWWKPKSRRADLIRAGALIIAEIERLDRRENARG